MYGNQVFSVENHFNATTHVECCLLQLGDYWMLSTMAQWLVSHKHFDLPAPGPRINLLYRCKYLLHVLNDHVKRGKKEIRKWLSYITKKEIRCIPQCRRSLKIQPQNEQNTSDIKQKKWINRKHPLSWAYEHEDNRITHEDTSHEPDLTP